MVSKGGVIAAAVVGVEHQRNIQHPGLQLRIPPVLTQHPEKILRRGQLRPWLVDKQALPLVEPIGLIGVNRQQRHNGNHLQALAQHISKADVIGLIVIAKQRQHRALHGVHQVLRRGF
ncbi:hypothetical protein SDC9_92003 [bioreactor metagenome]|uniref:Uncharacterized protein n=1 Tax=bioreactor metagenome TaxID=1076179 RepID=A0A644ZX44_9ZZZZ